jgi:uroporphyrinogen decarboxylase
MEVTEGVVWIHPVFPDLLLEEREHTLILRTKNGVIEEVPKDGHASIPRDIRSSIETPDDWKRVKEERFRLDDPARTVDAGALAAMHPPDRTYPVGVHCGSLIGKIRDMLMFQGLAYACFDYPDMVEDMVETCCLAIEKYLDQVLPVVKFDFAAGWEDICFKNGPIVTLDFFRSVIVPRMKRISTKLRDAGVDIWYTDCDGDVRHILPYLIEGGINTLFPHEVNGSGHPSALLDQYGKELRIMGGVDKMALIAGREEIRKYLLSLEPLVARGGFIPFVDHRCPVDVRPEDYLYYLDLKESLFGA